MVTNEEMLCESGIVQTALRGSATSSHLAVKEKLTSAVSIFAKKKKITVILFAVIFLHSSRSC